jgi:hypothetical protein
MIFETPKKILNIGITNVRFGENVTIVEPVNLYGCSIAANCFVGPFVEILIQRQPAILMQLNQSETLEVRICPTAVRDINQSVWVLPNRVAKKTDGPPLDRIEMTSERCPAR